MSLKVDFDSLELTRIELDQNHSYAAPLFPPVSDFPALLVTPGAVRALDASGPGIPTTTGSQVPPTSPSALPKAAGTCGEAYSSVCALRKGEGPQDNLQPLYSQQAPVSSATQSAGIPFWLLLAGGIVGALLLSGDKREKHPSRSETTGLGGLAGVARKRRKAPKVLESLTF